MPPPDLPIDREPKLPTDAGPCPICGRKMELKGATLREMYVAHKCPEKTLRAIDGAHRRADDPHPIADPTNRSKREKRRDAERLGDSHA